MLPIPHEDLGSAARATYTALAVLLLSAAHSGGVLVHVLGVHAHIR